MTDMGSWLTFRQVTVCAIALLYPIISSAIRPEADLSSFWFTITLFILMMIFERDVHVARDDWVRQANEKLSQGKRRYASRDVRRS